MLPRQSSLDCDDVKLSQSIKRQIKSGSKTLREKISTGKRKQKVIIAKPRTFQPKTSLNRNGNKSASYSVPLQKNNKKKTSYIFNRAFIWSLEDRSNGVLLYVQEFIINVKPLTYQTELSGYPAASDSQPSVW